MPSPPVSLTSPIVLKLENCRIPAIPAQIEGHLIHRARRRRYCLRDAVIGLNHAIVIAESGAAAGIDDNSCKFAPNVLRHVQSVGAFAPTGPTEKSPFRTRLRPSPVINATLLRMKNVGSSWNAKLKFVVVPDAVKSTL